MLNKSIDHRHTYRYNLWYDSTRLHLLAFHQSCLKTLVHHRLILVILRYSHLLVIIPLESVVVP